MSEKPTSASGYPPDQAERVKATCLYLATKLGDCMPEIVVVGGLVPSLLVDQQNLPAHIPPHAGTMDLDLGLAFAMVGEARYQEVADRLARAGFKPDKNDEGQTTRQRWCISTPPVTVDFLIEPDEGEAKPGSVFSITKNWAAFVVPGLHLAFNNSQIVSLRGKTITGEIAEREIRVCGAGAFIALKSLAFHFRGENKDAYDLIYLLRNYKNSVSDVAKELIPLLSDSSAAQAIEYLQEDFRETDAAGPRRVAEFLYGRPDPNTQADAVGFVKQLLAESKRERPE